MTTRNNCSEQLLSNPKISTPMKFQSMKYILLTGLLLGAAGIMTAQAASSTIVTFSVDMATNISAGTFIPGTDTVAARGTFNGYGQLPLVRQGSTTIYTNTVNDTTDANGGVLQYKFWDSNAGVGNTGWESPADGGKNRAAQLPSTVGASLVLPTPYFSDNGAPVTSAVTFRVNLAQEIITLGTFIPGTSIIYARGDFDGFNTSLVLVNDPSILTTNIYGLVTTDVYVGTTNITASPNAAETFKYYADTIGWEGTSPANGNPDHDGNRFFVNTPQTLPIVDFSDAPYAPLSKVTFNVDMSIEALINTNFNRASVVMWGDFNGWSTGITLTNHGTAPNQTNLYTAVLNIGQGSSVNYQYRYTNTSDSTVVFDHFNGANGGGNNRNYIVPTVTATNLPTVYFNDGSLNDYLLQPTLVVFSVDMANAVGTEPYTFDPSMDNVYINGQFPSWYAWSGASPVAAPPGFQMIEVGDSTIYTNSIMLPAGVPAAINYQYGLDPGALNGGPYADESTGQNHYRVVRNSGLNPYVMATDTFGVMYGEPYLNSGNTGGGNLTIGPISAGRVPVTWLGRPGARLQTTTDLGSGVWQTIAATDGTNWITGSYSTNGFVSRTNWPAGANTYFRLIKTQDKPQ